MNLNKDEQLITKAALICLREKYYGMMTSLNITMNNVAIDGLKVDLDKIDKLIDKIGK